MSEEFKNLVDQSFEKGINPIWIYTNDYIYGMFPVDDGASRWMEVTYDFDSDDPILKKERNADLSFQFLFEELEKGVSYYIEDFNVNNLKQFAATVENKSGSEKLTAIINDLINNTDKYSANLPIIKSKNDANILKEKV
ncbi:MAG: hypothetical protein JXA99_07850 [Candidatus Lokiarchaeota archaeon]|nr:hypothetical protein [Candidatus Lokiarchaeota archaeon]